MENLSKKSISHIDWYSGDELREIFHSVGNSVFIDRSVRIFNGKNIDLGHHVRIDAYGVLSAGKEGIEINNYIHIGPFCQLNGAGGSIQIRDFCSLSSRVSLFTASDDYSEGFMTGPMVPNHYKKITNGGILLLKHVIIGCNAMIMPGIGICEGASVGAYSLVNKNVGGGIIVSGQPIRKIGYRDLINLNEMEQKFYEEFGRDS